MSKPYVKKKEYKPTTLYFWYVKSLIFNFQIPISTNKKKKELYIKNNQFASFFKNNLYFSTLKYFQFMKFDQIKSFKIWKLYINTLIWFDLQISVNFHSSILILISKKFQTVILTGKICVTPFLNFDENMRKSIKTNKIIVVNLKEMLLKKKYWNF